MADVLLKDLIDIPESVHKSDFVVSVSDGIARPERTLEQYVVTPQLAASFERALDLITSSVEQSSSKGAYLHGSFGSGKSHFMAVLHLLLAGSPRARSVRELAPVLASHGPRLDGRQFLLVPYHMIGAESMESAVLGGYVDHVRRLHPDAPVPSVFRSEGIVKDAEGLRQTLGDEAFFAALGGGADDEGFGSLLAGWDAASYDDAVAAAPTDPVHQRLVGDLIASFFASMVDNPQTAATGFVTFEQGLAAISQHAAALGYDAVILFLDELVLWFASRMADPAFVEREGPKVAKLVEAPLSHRPVPIVSFIARQRDLRDFVGQGVPGAEKLNFGQILEWWEGRFDTIELADRNLPAIIAKRLLAPRSEAARQQLDAAFDRVAASARSALDTLMTSDGDRAMFRRVYPFSPALIETLVAVSSYLQRERTALRLLQQLLADRRDDLAVGDLVPLGDLWDVIAGGEEPFSEELRSHFARARDLYEHRLRPMLLRSYGLDEDQAQAVGERHPVRTDARLVKTLLLAALVPEVEPLRGLTVRRLTELNHGTIVAPIAGEERATALAKVKTWRTHVPEVRVEGDVQDPAVSVQLTDVDVAAVLDRARDADTHGTRVRKCKDLLGEMLGIDVEAGLAHTTYRLVWRGTRRHAEVLFANVRNDASIPDGEFRAGDLPRIVLDFPFDEPGFGPADDRARIQRLVAAGPPTATVCWLPNFLTVDALDRLGDLVVMDHVLSGDRFEGVAGHLSAQDRVEARQLIDMHARALREQLTDALRQAYGLDRADGGWVRDELQPADHLQSLDPALTVKPPTAATFTAAFEQVAGQMLAHRHPAHPRFDAEVSRADLRTTLRAVERAVQDPQWRAELPAPERAAVRKVAGPLALADVGEAHLALKRDWVDDFARQVRDHPGEAVTVERLRRWMDEPVRRGLTAEVANLVVSAWVLMTDRVLLLGGVPVEPSVTDLRPEMEARTTALPDEQEWQVAVERAAPVFGDPVPNLRNATNVSLLVDQLRGHAREHRDDVVRLAEQLADAARRFDVDTGADRLRTARAARSLVGGLLAAADVDAVRIFATAEIPTSPEALGRSIKSARQVAATLDRTNWDLIERASRLGGPWQAQAAGLRTRVVEALAADQLAADLAAALEAATSAATDLLARAAGADGPTTPKPEPESPPRDLERVGERTGLRGNEARELLTRLADRADDLDHLDVKWRLS